MVKVSVIILLGLCTNLLYAQAERKETFYEDFLATLLQDAFNNDANDDRFTFSLEEYVENLDNLTSAPILVDHPDRETLERIPSLYDMDINRLLAARNKDSLISESALRLYANRAAYPLTRSFVTYRGYRTNTVQFRSRVTTDPDAESQDEYTTNYYRGSPLKIYDRLRVTTDALQFNLLQAKGAGEPLFADHIAANITLLRPIPFGENIRIRGVVLGDYSLSFGEGLLFQSGIIQSKSSDVITPLAKRPSALKAYTSSSSYRFFRGFSGTLDIGTLSLTPFYSDRAIDATLTDSSTISSLSNTGYHRTTSELDRRQSARQETYGGHLDWSILQDDSSAIRIGGTAYTTLYDKTVDRSDTINTRFYGNKLSMLSVDGSASFTFLSASAEYARSSSNMSYADAYVLSVTSYPFDLFELSAQYRHLPENFLSPFGGVFGDNSDDAQNERGFYFGLRKMFLENKLALQVYADLSTRTEKTAAQDFFPKTNDYRFSATWLPHNFPLRVFLESRFRQREYLLSDTSTNSIFARSDKYSDRIAAEYAVTSNLFIAMRFGYVILQNETANENGYVAGGFLRYYPLWGLELETGISTFFTDSYDSRIYINESDIPGASSFTALYGKGERYYLLGKYGVNNFISLAAKLSGTTYYYKSDTPARNTLISFQIDFKM
jgi:hypothetical protein